MIATLVGNAILGSLVLICLIMCIQGTTKHPDYKEAYIITFLIMITIMYTINEGSAMTVWKWRANPKLAQTSAYIQSASQIAGAASRRVFRGPSGSSGSSIASSILSSF